MNRFLTANHKKAFALLALVAASLSIPACNTTEGVGEDIGALGDSINRSAEKHGADRD